MKNHWTAVAICLALVAVGGCSKNDSGSADTGQSQQRLLTDDSPTAKLGSPSDYFPTATGTRWTYDITVPSFEDNPPLTHAVTKWPRGDKALGMETRGRVMPPGTNVSSGHYRLVLSVAGPAIKQGPLEYTEGYELKIEQDDLDIFDSRFDHNLQKGKLFWAISHSSRYEANLVIMHDPDSPGAPSGGEWGSYGQEPGYCMRLAFFGDKPGTAIGLSDENDDLLFVGPETYPDADTLHFRRIVGAAKPRQDDSDHRGDLLDRGFTEDLWFAKGRGLVKLEQKIDGKTTMTWVIVK